MRYNFLLISILLLSVTGFIHSQSEQWIEISSEKGYHFNYGSTIFDDWVYSFKKDKDNQLLMFKQKGDEIIQVGNIFPNGDKYGNKIIDVYNDEIYVLNDFSLVENGKVEFLTIVYKLVNDKWESLGRVSNDPTCRCTDIEVNKQGVFVACWPDKKSASVYTYKKSKWEFVGDEAFTKAQWSGQLYTYGDGLALSIREQGAKKSTSYFYIYNGSSWKDINNKSLKLNPKSMAYQVDVVDENEAIAQVRTISRQSKLYMYKLGQKNKWEELDNEHLNTLNVKFASLYLYKKTPYLIYQDHSNRVYQMSYKNNKWSKPNLFIEGKFSRIPSVFRTPTALYFLGEDSEKKYTLVKLNL
jgi:hypothetical protein